MEPNSTPKQKAFLIHGTSLGVTYSVFRPSNLDYCCFSVCKDDIDDQTHTLFRWNQFDNKFTFLETINPLTTIKIFLKEREYISSHIAHKALFDAINKAKPSVIISHSLGGNYLLQTLNNFGVPDCVRKIVFLVSEMPRDLVLGNHDLIKRIDDLSLVIENYYCYYDPTLLSSYFLTGHLTSGNFGTKSKHIKNKFYPLTLSKFKDPHTSILRDKKLFERLINR